MNHPMTNFHASWITVVDQPACLPLKYGNEFSEGLKIFPGSVHGGGQLPLQALRNGQHRRFISRPHHEGGRSKHLIGHGLVR